MYYKFTNRAQKALELAERIAMDLGHNYIGTEHLLYGLAKEGTGVASKVLEEQNITAEDILSKIEELIGREVSPVTATMGFTPRTKRVIENSFRESKRLGSNYIGTEHILIGLMREADSIAVKILLDLNLNVEKLYNEIIKVINEYENNSNTAQKNSNDKTKTSYNSTTTLNQFGTEMTILHKLSDDDIEAVVGEKIAKNT